MKCKCSRIGEHCPQCGSISKHPLVQRTAASFGFLHIEVRFYRCRKCGVEYGWYQGKLYDQECLAPEDIRLKAIKKDPEEIAKTLNEAINTIQSYGGVVAFPKGILEEPIDSDVSSGISEDSKESENNGKDFEEKAEESEKELGFTRDSEGKLVAPFSIEEFLRKKKAETDSENTDENNH